MFPSSLTLETCLQQALDIRSPWSVNKAEFDRSEQLLRITLRHAGPYACPVCGAAAKRHDARRRTWRHLDFFEHRTLLTAEVPRVKCAEHGCRQVRVPWSEKRSAYTRTFEQRVLTELQTQAVRATASKLRMNWDAVAGIQVRVVARGPFGFTNAWSKSIINAPIQRSKKNVCDHRNRMGFRIAILFHYGGLDLCPTPPNN